MYKWYRVQPVAVVWLAIIASAGCGGLVSSDTPNIDLSVLEKQFSIDATAWAVNRNLATPLFAQTCNPSAAPDPCVAAVATLGACKSNTCTGICNADTWHCQLALRVELWRAVNLTAEVPTLLGGPDGDPSLMVALDDVTYEVSANSLSVATPRLDVYVAPATVMGPGGDGAVRIGTIPVIPPGEDFSPQSIQFIADGKEVLRRRIVSYQVPFNLLVASDLVVDQSPAIPTGKLSATVRMLGRAGH
jgi:hypothetical protein